MRRAVTTVTTAAAALAATVVLAGPSVAATHPAGPVGPSIVIGSAQDIIGGFDVAANPAGTAYVGWIANSNNADVREVHLCTLPVGARSCSGGVQTIPAGGSSANGLRVLATRSGQVTLVWMHDTAASINGPQGAQISTATAPQGLHLSAPADVASAPSFGELLDAEFAPSGAISTVAYTGVGTGSLQVRPALNSPYVTLHAPYSVGVAQLAFTGKLAVLAITKYGAVSSPAAYAVRSAAGSWGSFTNVAATWTTGGLTLVNTAHGLRLITGVNDASYRPVLATWNGHGFNRRGLTPDSNNCGPSSHDGATDPSGRLLDASWECNDVTVSNYADAANAAIVRIHTGGTPTFAPAIASGTQGIATVAWSNESAKGGSDLHVSRVRLATATRTVIGHARGGSVGVSGPISCLPPANTRVSVSGHAAHGWKLLRTSLKLGPKVLTSATLDGATLAAHKAYTLSGAAVFGKGTARSIARVNLGFSTC